MFILIEALTVHKLKQKATQVNIMENYETLWDPQQDHQVGARLVQHQICSHDWE